MNVCGLRVDFVRTVDTTSLQFLVMVAMRHHALVRSWQMPVHSRLRADYHKTLRVQCYASLAALAVLAVLAVIHPFSFSPSPVVSRGGAR